MLNAEKNTFVLKNEATIKWVAWMSFFWSLSTLMVFSVLPAFLVDELKMGHMHIGVLEGIAISSSFISKFLSGFLSDVMKDRKPLIMVGTLMSAATKPLFAVCNSAGMMFGIRFSDRLSKGIRSAPTDALIADLSDSSLYASNFGLRQSLYTFGAVAGASIAMLVMLLSGNNFRLVFALSLIPGLFSIGILWFLIKPDPKSHPCATKQIHFKDVKLSYLKGLPSSFWWLQVAFFFLMLARFSEAFLALKAKDVGWSVSLLPILIIVMDLVHAGIAWPSGKYADRLSRTQTLVIGLMLMIAAQSVLAYVTSVAGVCLGIVLLGLHMGTTQGLLKAMIAQSTPAEMRGTAFSLFFIISGFALFLSNTIAGYLSQTFGLYATFLCGALFTSMAALIMYAVFMRRNDHLLHATNAPLRQTIT